VTRKKPREENAARELEGEKARKTWGASRQKLIDAVDAVDAGDVVVDAADAADAADAVDAVDALDWYCVTSLNAASCCTVKFVPHVQLFF